MGDAVTSVTYGGVVLTDRWVVTDVVRPLPRVIVDTDDAPGRDGVVVRGARYGVPEVSMRVWAVAVGWEDQQRAVREIAATFPRGVERRLSFGDDGGLWRLAQPTGEREVRSYDESVSVNVTLLCADPVMYGAQCSASLSGPTVTATIGGTFPARPRVTVVGARPGADGTLGLLIGGRALAVALDGPGGHGVDIDCGSRTCAVDGRLALPTLDSDWPSLPPGAQAMSIASGTGSATVTWHERWL
ncbi:hypothetical protein ADJ70_03250 [Olsenella sp. oral taxon 807]|uniref:phage distal tail protein n=1 Tax=Olsenella sp. oral taxon 807 TaxID=712411 RepID=UPI00067A3590|nr:phage tail domain-containing protein [Olsenella sp. oral taxon 807]AKT48200.1 hypothetical protein ADJ70_03250 [Olsenella sp. oral taxon 807]